MAQADAWKAHGPTADAAALKDTALYVASGNEHVGPYDGTGAAERERAAESAAFVQRLAELKIPVTVYAYWNGTHNAPNWERDFQSSLPLILKALGV